MSDTYSISDLRQSLADANARRHLALHKRFPNGLLVWQAYAEYRQNGAPVSEEVLAVFDKWADRLRLAKTSADVLGAMDMAAKGRKTAPARLRATQRRRDVMEHYIVRRFKLHQPLKTVLEDVASQFHTTPGNVEKIASEWRDRPRKAMADPSDGRDLQQAWLRQKPE